MNNTAVKDLFNYMRSIISELNEYSDIDNDCAVVICTLEQLIFEKENQTIDKEKQQIIRAFVASRMTIKDAEQYYNETFGKQETIVTEYKDGTIQVETFKNK